LAPLYIAKQMLLGKIMGVLLLSCVQIGYRWARVFRKNKRRGFG
jgi:hypothetical protein